MSTWEDAEDVASEAMLRAATYDDLDVERLPQFLSAVTVRLCADLHRSAERGTRLVRRLGLDDEPSPEDLACEASDRAVVRELVGRLPASQRTVLVDRAYGLSVTQISQRHSLSYKAVESALSRARATVRAAMAAATAFALGAAATLRRRPDLETALPAASIVLVTAVVAPFLAPSAPGGDPLALPARPVAPLVRAEVRTAPAPLAIVPGPAPAPGRVRVASAERPEPKPKPTPSASPIDVGIGEGEDRVPVVRDSDGALVPHGTVESCASNGPTVETRPVGSIGPVTRYEVLVDCRS